MKKNFPILNLLLYWTPEKIQLLYFLDQVNQFIVESGSINDQETLYSYFCWYDPMHMGVTISSLDQLNDNNHLIPTTVFVDIYPS